MKIMEITVVENTPHAVKLSLSGADTWYVNALRRACMNSVKCFAIGSVTLYENTSSMFDEYLAHRLGLVPILSPDGYGDKDEILFTAEVEGPATFYSRDLKSKEKDVAVANGNIPIIKLAEGQKVRLDCKAVLGNSTNGAKFQPAYAAYKELGGKEKGYELYVESFGQMSASEVLKKALESMKKDMKVIYKDVKK
jgi:DNA-directed RNA polymerase subunit D